MPPPPLQSEKNRLPKIFLGGALSCPSHRTINNSIEYVPGTNTAVSFRNDFQQRTKTDTKRKSSYPNETLRKLTRHPENHAAPPGKSHRPTKSHRPEYHNTHTKTEPPGKPQHPKSHSTQKNHSIQKKHATQENNITKETTPPEKTPPQNTTCLRTPHHPENHTTRKTT